MRPFMAEHSNESRQLSAARLTLDKIFGCHSSRFSFRPAPMRVFPRSIKLPLDVSVQCSHDADARHHGGAAEFDNQEQRFYRGPPLIE